MPREKIKRGRRQEEKEKKRKADETYEKSSKRSKHDHDSHQDPPEELTVSGDAGDDFISFGIQAPPGPQEPEEESQFHGLLDPEEQEYYANVNTKIVANDFESPEDRAMFIEAVHRETEGKEMKVASSQSCSRYLEKIIMLSTPDQLRGLFSKFLGNLTYLVRHRFGSHCCETLFLELAKHTGKGTRTDRQDEEQLPTTEDLFLQAAQELESNMGYLLTDRFASHTVRVLFLILSGEPLDDASVKAVLASKKKEKLEAPLEPVTEVSETKRVVPKSFAGVLEKLIASAISSLDTTYLRALATHPLGNPVLQLLLRLELAGSGKIKISDENSVFKKLLPDQEFEEDSESSKFMSGLIYDPTGSHLVETLVQKLPGKAFKKLYKNALKPRLGSMAKNDTAGYVAVKILERLGKDDLLEAKGVILPELPTLISRRRTGVIKALVARCAVRRVDLQDLADVIKAQYGDDPAKLVPSLLDFQTDEAAQPSENGDDETKSRTSAHKTDVHGSLLAQAMLQASKTCVLIQESLLALDEKTLIQMAQDSASSRVIQTALAPTDNNAQFRRQFVPQFYPHIATLAQNLTGSYVADALWSGTDGLHFMKEKLARELAANETSLRESPFGRNVWKNWAMDSYYRRPGEWRAMAKGLDVSRRQTAAPSAGTNNEQNKDKKAKKSAIELAREKHVQRQMQGGGGGGGGGKRNTPATSANAVVVRTNA